MNKQHVNPIDIQLSTDRIAVEIEEGRIRAHEKHGDNSIEGIDADSPRWMSILVEEVGEAAHQQTYDAVGGRAALRAELLDVATVAVAWIAALDRGQPHPEHRPVL